MLCKNVFGISFFRKDSMKVNMDKIYIYVYIHLQETVSLYHNSSVWLDIRNVSSEDQKPPNFNSNFNSNLFVGRLSNGSLGI